MYGLKLVPASPYLPLDGIWAGAQRLHELKSEAAQIRLSWESILGMPLKESLEHCFSVIRMSS
jgi:hypothetical protein